MAYSLLGLDIGSNTIKAVQLVHEDKGFRLHAAGLTPTPPKGFSSEAETDLKTLSETIRSLITDLKISTPNVVSALPESAIFTRVISLPSLTDKELASAIHWEAEQFVPVSLEEVNLVWEVLSRPKKTEAEKMEVLLIAAPKNLGEKYVSVLESAGLKPVALETELIAVARSLVGERPDSPTTLVISVGAKTTDLCIVNQGKIALTRSIATGGTALARAIAAALGFELSQAEEYKKSYGLLRGEMEDKIVKAIKPVFEVIVTEVKRALAFYQEQKPTLAVKRAVLCGGSAKLPGAVVYLAETLGFEVQVGDSWARVAMDEKRREKLGEEASIYTVAVGLAMRRV
jgi:type IV pilus assembly protein PilM